ncbi:oligopeptidase A [Candidatus Berkiella aquae]|uniref:oligopeptidase A n=1 Tax=Candidatus Berkiella aquae TaxID=295108 RepID=A0A0Q9YKJ0_9GAMM|nr:oligopeptidase A [Candidatus Berkiella aquae]MCS5709822.1 oligopeptidase A [Candidatus Berkiella aquae]
MKNPLLEPFDLPPFARIQAEHVTPAINTLIERNLKQIDELTKAQQNPTWDSLIAPIEALDDELNKAWSPVSHLNSVLNTKELREAYHQCLPKLSEYGTTVGQNKNLYDAYIAIKSAGSFSALEKAQQKTITNAIRDFELSGVALPAAQKEQFAQLSKKLSELQSRFQDNVMDATDSWHFDVKDENELMGIPKESIALAKQVAEKAQVAGWRLTLDFPCYYAVITHANNRELRKMIHKAYNTRASELGENPEKWNNAALMEQILATRHELARLLGFANFAERSLIKKMAKKTDRVMNFLNDLAKLAKPFAEKEFAELKAFAKEKYDMQTLEPWDIAYYSEKLQQAQYSLSEELLRPYFPAPQVINGLFEVVKRLYGLHIVEETTFETWHPDVRFFAIYDKEQQLLGKFYLDLYARNQKRGGAWMDEACVRRVQAGKLQIPVAYLTCNFRAPLKDEQALLTHDEVITLFHEFGHGLHHLLTKIDYPSVSGINGVPWDAVELPSQFMENWCWQEEALAFISSHYQTKEPLPQDLLQKMMKAKNFQSAMMLMRQLEFALFDFRIHLEYDPKEGGRIQPILDNVRLQYSVVPVAAYSRFPHSFSHIFAGGYAAGYYSYLWAEVLSSDAFSRFEEEGIFNQKTGADFLHKILEKGGSEDPDILFKDFRGRDPELAPLLKHRGLSS